MNDRCKQIIEYLKLRSFAKVEELVALTGSSPATVRRDIIKLDSEGSIYRVHGGVTLNRFLPNQPTTSEKQQLHQKEKQLIGEAAAALIKPGNSVVLDAGTTTIEIARNIIDLPVRVITPDLHIGLLLAEYKQLEVSVTGGSVDWSSQSCIGPYTVKMLSAVHPTYTFISCNAFKLETGITAPTAQKANVKSVLLSQSSKRVLVADSSKYGGTQLFEVGPVADLDMIITDSGLDPAVQEEIRKIGVELVVCGD